MAAGARMRRGQLRADALSTKLLDAFCDALWLEDGLARNTIASYRADLQQLGSFVKKNLGDATEADLFAFLGSRKGRASSAARRVSTLKRFYQYCLRERRIAADPTLKLEPPKRVPRFPKTLSEADVEALQLRVEVVAQARLDAGGQHREQQPPTSANPAARSRSEAACAFSVEPKTMLVVMSSVR